MNLWGVGGSATRLLRSSLVEAAMAMDTGASSREEQRVKSIVSMEKHERKTAIGKVFPP